MLKTVSSITNAIGALNYKGTWNASSNTPTLADGSGTKGDYYVVSTAGTQTFGGVQLFFGTGDWIAYNGAVWQRVEGGSDGNFANVTLTSTDAGATASPLLELYRDSASPAASDTLGEIEFNGEDSAGNKQAYGLIHASILSPTSTTEQGQLHFETATAGALTEKMIIGTTNLVINEIGAVFNVRIEGDTDANLFYTDATNSRVGIGKTNPATKLDVDGTITSTGVANSALTSRRVTFATTGGLLTDDSFLTYNSIGNLLVGTTNDVVWNTTNLTGCVIGGAASLGGYSSIQVSRDGDSCVLLNRLSSDGNIQVFAKQGVGVGSISVTTTATSYNIVSDYRLKENIAPMVGALDKVAKLKPVTYTWKVNGSSGQGFIAHELAEVVSDCVTGKKDAVDAEGKPQYQGIDTSFLIATLTAAIQEQQTLIESLKNRLTVAGI